MLRYFIAITNVVFHIVGAVVYTSTQTRNSSGDEIANVNFLYDDIVHALKIQWTLA